AWRGAALPGGHRPRDAGSAGRAGMIQARGLSRSFEGRPAVTDLSFTVPDGRLCALLGPNGAGKTTTIRMLLGLLPPDGGSALVAGVELPASDAEGARLRRHTGLL